MIQPIKVHASKPLSVFLQLNIEISQDSEGIRYQEVFWSNGGAPMFSRRSRWQSIKYSYKGAYFMYKGVRQYLNEFIKRSI